MDKKQIQPLSRLKRLVAWYQGTCIFSPARAVRCTCPRTQENKQLLVLVCRSQLQFPISKSKAVRMGHSPVKRYIEQRPLFMSKGTWAGI